jgi:type III restriction enzyme
MPLLTQGRVLAMNWHGFEPQAVQVGGVSARVVKAGIPVTVRETIVIGTKTTTARGTRYLTPGDLDRQLAAGLLTVLGEERDPPGNLKKVFVQSTRYVESDTALVKRILGREVGGTGLDSFLDPCGMPIRVNGSRPHRAVAPPGGYWIGPVVPSCRMGVLRTL